MTWIGKLFSILAPWYRAHAQVHETLLLLESLLRKYGHPDFANLAAAAATLMPTNPEQACKALSSDHWWGPGPCISSIEFTLDGGFSREARCDSLAFKRGLTTLYQCMRAYGEDHPLAELQVSQFDKVAALRDSFKPLAARAGTVNDPALSNAELRQVGELNLPLLKEMNKAVKMYEKAEQ